MAKELDHVFKQLKIEAEDILKVVDNQRNKMERSFEQIVLKTDVQSKKAQGELEREFKLLEKEYLSHAEEYKKRTNDYLSQIEAAFNHLEQKHEEFSKYSQERLEEVRQEINRYEEIFVKNRDARKRLIKEKNDKYTDQVIKDIILLLGI